MNFSSNSPYNGVKAFVKGQNYKLLVKSWLNR